MTRVHEVEASINESSTGMRTFRLLYLLNRDRHTSPMSSVSGSISYRKISGEKGFCVKAPIICASLYEHVNIQEFIQRVDVASCCLCKKNFTTDAQSVFGNIRTSLHPDCHRERFSGILYALDFW